MSKLGARLQAIDSFGAVDASMDEILISAFEDHAAYRSALDLKKFMIIGRKGSGKSAVYHKLTRDKKSDIQSLGFTFADYPWQHHGKQKQTGVPDEECYAESWKYFISLMLCRLILDAKDKVSAEPAAKAAVRDIEAFVRDSYGSTKPSLTTIFTPGQKIKVSGKLNFWGAEGEVKAIDVEHLPTYYSEINRNILDCIIRCIPRNVKFFVCFDELDIGFDPKKDDYLQRLIGLIRAAKYINERLMQERIKAAAIVLLRDDIWGVLRFEDKNKIPLSEIKWSQEDGEHSLKRLMERRFASALGDGKSVSWDQVFDSQKMAQNQSKYDYICRRGFLRPRDIILYCNEVLECYKSSRSDGLFTNELVKQAERGYSNRFLLELQDELQKHSRSYERYFDVLKDLLNVGFSQEEFNDAWKNNWCESDGPEGPKEALEALFEFSVIGFLATGGFGAGSKYVWRYLDPRTKFNPQAKAYQVHLGLKEEFELKLYARRRQ